MTVPLLSMQWRAEVWWFPERLLDWMPPYQILVLSSGVWWSLFLAMHCLWRHSMTLYSRLQTNVLPKFVHTTCIFKDARAAVGKQSRRHPKHSSKTHQIELWSTIHRGSFYQISECQAPLNRRKAPLLKTLLRRFCREGGVMKQLRAMETYKKLLPIMFLSVRQQCWPQK